LLISAVSPTQTLANIQHTRTQHKNGQYEVIRTEKPPKTPPRSINKVPDIGSLEGEDQYVGLVGTNSSMRSGIPFHVYKQLAQDIESNKVGGIRALVGLPPKSQQVAQLLDKDDEVYGPPGGELRNKLGKKGCLLKKATQPRGV
jgi:hypothetical protein